MSSQTTRRTFVQAAGIAGVAGAAALTAVRSAHADEAAGAEDGAAARNTTELAIPAPEPAPETTVYTCDVLVVGGGWAGLNAAMAAANAGCSVVLVDKGKPGYSGLAPWPSSHRWLDTDLGDDPEAFATAIQRGGEYVVNKDWFQVWIDESKDTYNRLTEWGIFDRYDRIADTDYWDSLDIQGYFQANAGVERHARWIQTLEGAGVTHVDFTMITDVLTDGGRVVGAMGLHVPSGAVMQFNAPAVVMCTGGGCYKPTGFPVGGNTFDGEYIAYNLGLPIAGKEYDDFHTTCSYAPGNAFINNNWDYVENIWFCGGDITADNAATYGKSKFTAMVGDRITKAVEGVSPNSGVDIEDQANGTITRRGGTVWEDNPDDPRQGKMVSPKPKGDVYGVAVGMCAHLSSGVWCGFDDLEGYTGIPGLWYAGDGANASMVTGATYPVGVGFTSSFCSIQGDRAGKAAAAYAATAEPAEIPADVVASTTEAINAPLTLEKGFDPNCARDQLQAIMAPYWITIAKNETVLQGALNQIEHMRDNVVPMLMASNPHELRLVHEMKHKVLSAEMKLRSSLERKESRGLHYRTDYPFRDDENYLTYTIVQRGDDGAMQVSSLPVKDEWKGDLTEDYATRYASRFPGEAELLGLPVEETSGGWG